MTRAEEAKAAAKKAVAGMEVETIIPFVAELREAQAKIDADAYDYGDKQKGRAADLIERLFAYLKQQADEL